MENAKRVTRLPEKHHLAKDTPEEPPNPARDVQEFVGKAMNQVFKPVEIANLALAKSTQWLSNLLPSFPAVRCYRDFTLGWPHSHPHPPTFGFPLPSIGPVLLAGATNVLINGFPAARSGDVGFGVWCGGYYPLFEVFTGSSNVFIGGARPARQFIDFTKHCLPGIPGLKGVEAARKGLSRVDKLMMGFTGVMGALGMGAALTDMANYQEQADSAESESDAKEAEAKAHAAGIEAAMAGVQAAADIAAMALSVGMGKDPGVTPFTCWGNFIMGSPNVLIGGFPMPGWMVILRGLKKLLRRRALKIEGRLPKPLQKVWCLVFEPIDVVSGANIDDFTDFILPAPRFVWRRWYNSQQQQAGRLGWGFRHEYELELKFDHFTSQFTYTDQEGNSITFPSFATEYPSERVVQHGYVLKRLAVRRYELTAHNKPATEFEFGEMSEPARPVALRDGEHIFKFDYDAEGRLIGIGICEGKKVRINYSLAGFVSEVLLEQPGQEMVYVARYRHDERGCLIEFRDALNQSASYEYDNACRMMRKIDRRGYSYHYNYDDQGRCVYTSGEDGMYEGWLEYHPENRATVVKYSDGGSWTYEYNELGTITKIIDPYGGTQHRLVDPASGKVTHELDPAGNPTELLYDEQGAQTGRRDPLGYWAPPLNLEPHPADPLEHRVPETPLEWEFGNLIEREFMVMVFPDDPLLERFPEVAAEIAQSKKSGLASSRSEKYDLLGRLIERRNDDGSIECWEYDAEGNEILYVDGDGGKYRKEYTSWNLLSRKTDPASNTCTFKYTPTEEIKQFIDAGGVVHDFIYDKKDRLVEVRRDETIYDVYIYDEADNLLEKSDGMGKRLLVCEPGFGGLDRVQRFANGEVYQFEYNERGRITRAQTNRDRFVFDYDEDGRSTRDLCNGLGVENEFAGDELIATRNFGRFITRYRKQYDNKLIISDPTGRVHTFYIKENGLILKELASGTKELIQYEAEGRCLRKIKESPDGMRQVKSYRYSPAGNLLQIEDSQYGIVKYHIDEAHRLRIAERDDGRNELYSHDSADNLILQPGMDEVRITSGNKLKQVNGERFYYNHRDNIILRKSEKRTVSYEYDSFDQLVGITLNDREWQADYDVLGRRIRKRWAGETTKYYWDNDRLAGEIKEDGSVRVYVYVDECALVPFIYIDYDRLEAEPESGKVKYLFTNHLGVPELVEDEFGTAIWRVEISPYGAIRPKLGHRSEINLRFPGHYNDPETELHYNRFRYYDPLLGRYLQCDPLGIAGGYNLYAYPANPLIGVDILGLRHKNQTGRSREKGDGPARPKRTRKATAQDVQIPGLGISKGSSRYRQLRSLVRQAKNNRSYATRGNYSLRGPGGSIARVSRAEADWLGSQFVGANPGASSGGILVSRQYTDMSGETYRRVYRPPQPKPQNWRSQTGVQSNFVTERQVTDVSYHRGERIEKTRWEPVSNGHVDVED